MIQRQAETGTVYDAYVWESDPAENHNWSQLYTGRVGWGRKKSLLRFDLSPIPSGVTVHNARLMIYRIDAEGHRTVYVHRITRAWDEDEVTWDNFNDAYDPIAVGSFNAQGEGWKAVSVTSLVQDWISGNYVNYGLLLEDPSAGEDECETYYSSEYEDTTLRPKLEICWSP